MRRERIDKLLVERGLAASRTKAQALVMAGRVLAGEQRVEKPSEMVCVEATIRLKGAADPAARYVGRGGLKLEAGLDKFKLDVTDWVCLDVGASTAIDVGHNQIDWRLRNDARVETREGVNARYLKPEDFAEEFDLAVMDVSFISATKVMPAIIPLLKTDGRLVVLIKPQFEVGRGEVGKGGIVSDPAKHERVIEAVNRAAEELGLSVGGVTISPIRGADGNVEFLALYERVK